MSMRHRTPIFTALAIVLFVYAGSITYWTWRPFGSEIRSEAYDSLAEHLSTGSAEVDEAAIDWEGFKSNGRVYAYFGPFPAVLRIVPNILFPLMRAAWPRVSCFLASLVSLIAFCGIVLRCIPKSPSIRKDIFLFFTLLGFGLGTPLLYLMSCGRIYHEAVLWGLAGSVASFYFIVKLVSNSDTPLRDTFFFNFFASVALLSRVTFGIPLCLTAFFLFIKSSAELRRRKWLPEVLKMAWAFLPLGIGLLFQGWYNFQRFGSIWSFIDYSLFYIQPGTIGGEFNLARIPSTLYVYLSPFFSYFQAQFPYVRMLASRYPDPGLFFDWREQVLPLTLGSPWILFPGLWGLVRLWRKPHSLLLRVASVAFVIESFLILTYFFATQRYSADFMPLIIVGFAAFLLKRPLLPISSTAALAAYALIVLVSASVTGLGVLHWMAHSNGDAPIEFRQKLLKAMYRLPPVEHSIATQLAIRNALKIEFGTSPLQDKAVDGSDLALRGRVFASGIGVNSPGRFFFVVPSRAKYFEALVGISDSAIACDRASAEVRITDRDGEEVYSTGRIGPFDSPIAVKAEVEGLRVIILEVSDAGDGPDCDHVNIVEPRYSER